jgi:hypothetical protein
VHGWKSTFAIAGALVLVAGILVAVTIVFGETDDPRGLSLAALVTGYWLAALAVGIVLVRGILYAFRRLNRRSALFVALGALLAIPVAIVLHNVIYAITGEEEAVFFVIALFVGPVVLIAALVRAMLAGPRGAPPPTPGGGRPVTGH